MSDSTSLSECDAAESPKNTVTSVGTVSTLESELESHQFVAVESPSGCDSGKQSPCLQDHVDISPPVKKEELRKAAGSSSDSCADFEPRKKRQKKLPLRRSRRGKPADLMSDSISSSDCGTVELPKKAVASVGTVSTLESGQQLVSVEPLSECATGKQSPPLQGSVDVSPRLQKEEPVDSDHSASILDGTGAVHVAEIHMDAERTSDGDQQRQQPLYHCPG